MIRELVASSVEYEQANLVHLPNFNDISLIINKAKINASHYSCHVIMITILLHFLRMNCIVILYSCDQQVVQ